MDEVYVLPRRLKSAVLGGILLLVAAGMALAVAVAYVRPEGLPYRTLFVVFAVIFGLWFLIAAAVYFSNALRRYQLAAGKEGIYVNCTLVPFGLIPWSQIKSVSHAANSGLLDALLEPGLNALILELRSPAEFKRGLNIPKRILFFAYGGRVKVTLSLCRGKGYEIVNAVNGLFLKSRGDTEGADGAGQG